MHEHKTNSDSTASASDTRDNKLTSKSSVFKPKSASDNTYQTQQADIKTIPQLQGDIRHKHKTNSDSTVSASDTRDNNMISKQYPGHKEISGTSTKPTQTQLYQNQIPETIR